MELLAAASSAEVLTERRDESFLPSHPLIPYAPSSLVSRTGKKIDGNTVNTENALNLCKTDLEELYFGSWSGLDCL